METGIHVVPFTYEPFGFRFGRKVMQRLVSLAERYVTGGCVQISDFVHGGTDGNQIVDEQDVRFAIHLPYAWVRVGDDHLVCGLLELLGLCLAEVFRFRFFGGSCILRLFAAFSMRVVSIGGGPFVGHAEGMVSGAWIQV